MNLLVNGLFRRVQYTETLVDPQPFQAQKYPGYAYETEDQRSGLDDAAGDLVPDQRPEGKDGDTRGGEQGRAKHGDVPEIVGGQWLVTEAKWNAPTRRAGATLDPNEV